MQPITIVQHSIQQPLMPVLGLLAGAAAAKGGHGDWAAIGILSHFAVTLTFTGTRSVSARVAARGVLNKPDPARTHEPDS
jgi:Na+/glutamate symporter